MWTDFHVDMSQIQQEASVPQNPGKPVCQTCCPKFSLSVADAITLFSFEDPSMTALAKFVNLLITCLNAQTPTQSFI